MPTKRVYAKESAAIFAGSPDINGGTASTLELRSLSGGSSYIVLTFDLVGLEGKQIISPSSFSLAYSTLPSSHIATSFWLYAAKELTMDIRKWISNEVTYNNLPFRDFSMLWGSEFRVTATAHTYVNFLYNSGGNSPENDKKFLRGLASTIVLGPANASSVEKKAYFHSSRGSMRPYADLTYQDAKFSFDNQPPPRTILPKNVENRFSWDVSLPPAVIGFNGETGKLDQKTMRIQWRKPGETEYHEYIQEGNGGSHWASGVMYVPAGTFTDDEIEYRWATETPIGVLTTSDWATASTVDTLSTATAISPISTYIDGTEANTFTWGHSNSTGTKQQRADLQTSADGGTSWQDLITFEGESQTGIVPADALSGGSILWRVRTYNTDGVAGPWSEAAPIVVYAAGPAPIFFDIKETPRPTIRWQSTGQEAYELEIGDYHYQTFGTEKSHTTNAYFEDGQYPLRIRVQNSLGLWSKWAEQTISIQNAPGPSLQVTAVQHNNGVELSFPSQAENEAFTMFYIYRDGTLIGKTTERVYTDYLSNGTHQYRVRGALANGNYSMSNEIAGTVKVKRYLLSTVSPISWIELGGKIGQNPTHSISTTRQVNYQSYAGRVYPVAEVAEFKSRIHTLEFSLQQQERGKMQEVNQLLGKRVVYKDLYGDVALGVLGDIQQSGSRYLELGFTITETGEEAICYDL